MSADGHSTSSSPSFVYTLQCADGTYYVRHMEVVSARLHTHNAGKGARWTSCRLPVQIVYSEPAADEASAVAREAPLKHWSAAKKRALIEGRVQYLKRLSRCRTRWGKPELST